MSSAPPRSQCCLKVVLVRGSFWIEVRTGWNGLLPMLESSQALELKCHLNCSLNRAVCLIRLPLLTQVFIHFHSSLKSNIVWMCMKQLQRLLIWYLTLLCTVYTSLDTWPVQNNNCQKQDGRQIFRHKVQWRNFQCLKADCKKMWLYTSAD